MTVIGFTRPASKLEDSKKEAEEMGFEVMVAPSLLIYTGDDKEFNRLEESAGPGVPVIFGSSTAVEECKKHFDSRFAPLFEKCEVISIGPSTSKALEKEGIKVHSVPEDYSSYGLLDMMKDKVAGRKVVIVRSDRGSKVLSDGLTEAGAEVIDIAAYKLEEAGMSNGLLHMIISIKRKAIDYMAFTSPLSAESFFAQIEDYYGKEKADRYLAENVKIAAIGKPTALKLESLGRKPDLVPEKTTFHDMLEAIKAATE